MPRSGGIYTLPPIYLAENGETIMPDQHNIPLEDVAQALTGSLPTDGTAPMQGAINMNGNKITQLAAATNPGDAVRFDQLPSAFSLGPYLNAVNGLTMAADEITYATGAGTAAKTTVTAAGRAILDDADAAAQRTTLGLGSLSTVTPTGTASADTVLYGNNVWGVSPTAIAGAVAGAPRIEAMAVKAVSTGITGAGVSPATFIGLGDFETVTFCADAPNGANFQIGYTSDNGASWTGWDNLTGDGGKLYVSYSRTTQRMIPVSNASLSVNIPNQPPLGLNGVRFRVAVGSAPFYVHVAAGGV